jgi:lipopolysaccharide export LptBFGC system permease protein LptF
VAAAAFTFLRLSRFNELTAMMAAGMHLVRVAAPAIFCAVIVSLVLPLINQELIIPSIIPELTRNRSDQPDARQKSQAIQNMQDSDGRLLFAAAYAPPGPGTPAVLTELNVLDINEDFVRADFITAEKATYDPETGSWKLDKGTITVGLGQGARGRKATPIDVYKSNVTPEEIALFRSGDFVELLPTARINELLDPQRTRTYGTNDLLRVKHARLAQLLLNIIMVLLAISSVLIREPGQLKFAVMKCIILVGFCMATIFICQSMAAHAPSDPRWTDRWAALMAWVPIFVFGPLSVFLIDRVKT